MNQALRVFPDDRKSLRQWNNLVNHVGMFLHHLSQSVPTQPATRRVVRMIDEVGDILRNLSLRRDLLNLLAVALAVLSLSACASSEYMGISLKFGLADTDLRDLAGRAKAGDKQAQLLLGVAFEEGGRGLARNLTKARNLYRLAASDSGGPVWVYVPSVGAGQLGRMIQVYSEPRQHGLVQAKLRLEALDEE